MKMLEIKSLGDYSIFIEDNTDVTIILDNEGVNVLSDYNYSLPLFYFYAFRRNSKQFVYERFTKDLINYSKAKEEDQTFLSYLLNERGIGEDEESVYDDFGDELISLFSEKYCDKYETINNINFLNMSSGDIEYIKLFLEYNIISYNIDNNGILNAIIKDGKGKNPASMFDFIIRGFMGQLTSGTMQEVDNKGLFDTKLIFTMTIIFYDSIKDYFVLSNGESAYLEQVKSNMFINMRNKHFYDLIINEAHNFLSDSKNFGKKDLKFNINNIKKYKRLAIKEVKQCFKELSINLEKVLSKIPPFLINCSINENAIFHDFQNQRSIDNGMQKMWNGKYDLIYDTKLYGQHIDALKPKKGISY